MTQIISNTNGYFREMASKNFSATIFQRKIEFLREEDDKYFVDRNFGGIENILPDKGLCLNLVVSFR